MFAALLAGCYQPAAEATCSVHCPSGVCPSGMTCGGDGLCRSSPTDNCAAINDGGNVDDPDATPICFGHGLIHDFCVTNIPTDRTFTGGTLMTNDANCDATLVQTDGTIACFVIARSITITGVLRVIGPNPIVFLGESSVLIAQGAGIDVSSHAPPTLDFGAGGAMAPGCTSPGLLIGENDPTMSAGGGGAGGSFKNNGGPGGAGVNVQTMVAGGNFGAEIATLTTVRGGCAGGAGGNGSQGSAGLGGLGGGAVYLLSGNALRIYGTINASGAGGGAPKVVGGGGGGGGSGGFIGLDAAVYDFSDAKIFAVGGSGASGANASSPGKVGNEAAGPASPGPTNPPSGAGAGGGGGDFANGAGGDPGTNSAGGGGGGSRGFIGIAGLAGMAPVGAQYAPMPAAM
jgi:hypothetical protein